MNKEVRRNHTNHTSFTLYVQRKFVNIQLNQLCATQKQKEQDHSKDEKIVLSYANEEAETTNERIMNFCTMSERQSARHSSRKDFFYVETKESSDAYDKEEN